MLGTYSSNITINAIPDKTCEIDPHWFGPCESWIPGHYLLTIGRVFDFNYFHYEIFHCLSYL